MYTDVYINTNNKLISFIDILIKMANAIKYWRNKRNMTQQKLADLIGIDKEINFITNKILRKIGFDKLPEGIKK